MNNITDNQKAFWLPSINEALQKNVQEIVAGKINNSTARRNLKTAIVAAGYNPEKAHLEACSPEDLLWEDRIDLVLKTNVEMAQGQTNWLQSQRFGVLDAFPADDFFRLESGVGERDWLARFRLAGEQTGDPIGTMWTITQSGRMIALKNHPIWIKLGSSENFSDGLNQPWPPFAFNSGMWVRDVSRTECENFGLLKPGAAAPSVKLHKIPSPSPVFISIEDKRINEYFWNKPQACEHCNEKKPNKLLCLCDNCGESICPDCKKKGCSETEQPPEPQNAMQCFNSANIEMMGAKLPLQKFVAERVLEWCDQAFKLGFTADLRYFEARAYKMRGEAFESLGNKDRALREYELAMEIDPQVNLKKQIIFLRKDCAK